MTTCRQPAVTHGAGAGGCRSTVELAGEGGHSTGGVEADRGGRGVGQSRWRGVDDRGRLGGYPRVGVGLLVEGLASGVDRGDRDLVPVHRDLEVVKDLRVGLRRGHTGTARGARIALAGRTPAEGVNRSGIGETGACTRTGGTDRLKDPSSSAGHIAVSYT